MFLLIVSRQLTVSRSCSPRHVPAYRVTVLLTVSLSCSPCHSPAYRVTFLLTMTLSCSPCYFPSSHCHSSAHDVTLLLTLSLSRSPRHSLLTTSLFCSHVILLLTTSLSCSPVHFPAHHVILLLTTPLSCSSGHFPDHHFTFLLTTSLSCLPRHFPAQHVTFLLIVSLSCPPRHCLVAACVGGREGVYVGGVGGRGKGGGRAPCEFSGIQSTFSHQRATFIVSSPTGHSVATASLSRSLCPFADHPRLAVSVVVFHCIIESTHLKLHLLRCRLCWLFKKALRPILTSVDVSTQAFSVR